jgi:hypothetical protein
MQHIIKKQVIELAIDKQLDAFAIQQQVSDWYWHHFLSLLEVEFNKLSTPGEVHTIDRLEIDLGVISQQQLQSSQFHKIVLPAITKKVQEYISSEQAATTDRKRSGARHAFTQWLQYMQKGFLPWNVLQITAAWLNQVLEELASEHHSVTLLRNEIQKNKIVCARIAQQHTSPWLVQLVTVFTANNQRYLPDALAEVEKLFTVLQENGGAQIATSSRKQLWQQVLQLVAAKDNQLTTTRLATIIIQDQITIAHLPALEKINRQRVNEYPQLQPVLTVVEEELQQASRETDSITRQPEHTTNKNRTDDRPQAGDSKRQLLKEEGGLFVQHAGLVLIHPFLRSLFSLCGLLEGKTFSNAINRQKAIYLLHYIATGKVTVEEHELVIPKILCSYPIEETVDTDIILSIQELQEADDLMRAAIAQWSILKSTSSEGLQQGFLQRNGKLHTRNDQLYIEVEKNTIDVLLDHLPWNLSLIRLPWSGEIIRVEWR